ncbi:hypothetical protein Cni_G03453 [Canna indica]|uniref:Uncharacterized protein n=1 Tax=Canna indica TaxID=4628 RepID=A0AAQ3Q3J2_9LILI|nr:hypothetical protein Cni_G03453 [Canna indica]
MEKSLLELRNSVAKRADQLLQESCNFRRKQQQLLVGGAAFANIKNEANVGVASTGWGDGERGRVSATSTG